jgi:hypothetical protein
MLSDKAISRIANSFRVATTVKLNTTYFILKNPSGLAIPKEVELVPSGMSDTFLASSSIVQAIADLNNLETSVTEQVAEQIYESSLYNPADETFVQITLAIK